MDKEYILLTEIEKNPQITQRELSKMVQCSVGSINILLRKMANQGLIQIERMPMRRILYKLTHEGNMERQRKSTEFIRSNYNYLESIRDKIWILIEGLIAEYGKISLLLEKDEISVLVKSVVGSNDKVTILSDISNYDEIYPVVIVNIYTYLKEKNSYKNVINLIEYI